jgi:hypothetical protein
MTSEPIRDGWASYCRLVLKPESDINDDVVDASHVAFFSGAFQLWSALMQCSPEEREQMLEAIHREMQGFVEFVVNAKLKAETLQ